MIASPLPIWLKTRWVVAAAAGLALSVLFLSIVFLKYEQRNIQESGINRSQQIARLLEHSTTSDLSHVDALMRAVEEQVTKLPEVGQVPGIHAFLRDSVQGRPEFRSLSVLDAQGRILASSNPDIVAQRMDLGLLGNLPDKSESTVLTPLLAGRDLSDLMVPAAGGSASRVMPMVSRLDYSNSAPLLVIGLVNIDFFGRQYQVMVNDDKVQVGLASYAGNLLATTPNVARLPGDSLKDLPLFKEYLPNREMGRYVGASMDNPKALVAFQTSRRWPLVLLVEQPYAQAMHSLGDFVSWTLSGIAFAWTLIAFLTYLATRSLDQYSEVNAQLLLAAEAVSENEARYLAVLESSMDGILTFDWQLRILAANAAALHIFGRDSQAMVGCRISDLLDTKGLLEDPAALGRTQVNGAYVPQLNRRMETRGLRTDGQSFAAELAFVPLRLGGEIVFTATVRDISGQKAAEAEKSALLGNYRALAADLARQTVVLEEMRQRELEIGTRIQQSLLSALPTQHMPGFWLSSYNQSSKGIDGDFVEIVQLGDYCMDIIAGDVMGKGVPAALMGAATKLQFSRSIAELLAADEQRAEPPEPRTIVSSVHRAMTPHLQALEAFVTLTYVRIDSVRNTLTWVGCGHEEPLVIGLGGAVTALGNQHPPLGVLDDDQYVQHVVPFGPGDSVFLCSDGASDAIKADGERVGRDAINVAISRLVQSCSTPAAALHVLRKEMFPAGVQINDDLTMVLLMRPQEVRALARCELPAAFTALRTMRQFVTEQLTIAGIGEDEAALLEVACAEVFTNILRHASGLLPHAPIELMARRTPGELVLEFIHIGEAFSPPDEVRETNFAEFPEGGFG
ncbi:MAG: SpoIIE family protein phosphatase, partial [Rhodoferax sp.]|nr:SpoIIE family protein phosphatase [Rhodoferax sp.]